MFPVKIYGLVLKCLEHLILKLLMEGGMAVFILFLKLYQLG